MARGRTGLAAALVVTVLATGACTSVFGVDDGVSQAPRAVDERAGSIEGVGLGASETDVRAAFGEPLGGEGVAPDGEVFRGPVSLSYPGGEQSAHLRYEETTFLVSPSTGVYALMTTNDGDRTSAGVAIGDPLERVREGYEDVRCGRAPAGEPIWREEPATYPWCRTRVGDVEVFFGDDPIEAITLGRPGSFKD
jgi:hypothetical protein